MIAEDDQIVREAIVNTIQWEEYHIQLCGAFANGADAYEAFQTIQPDLLLTDIRMPHLNGLELIEKAKQDYEFEAILLSGYNDFKFAQKGLRLGVIDYLLKPCRPEEIIQVLLTASKRMNKHKPTVDQQQMVPAAPFGMQNQKRLHKTVEAALEIIHSKYNENISLDSIAQEVFVSTSYLSSLFKQEMNINFLDYLHQYRIEQAKHLLKDRLKIYAVAKLTGYQDERHFTKIFKRWTGQTPSQFQRLN